MPLLQSNRLQNKAIKHWRRVELRLAEFSKNITKKDHITNKELQELAEAFVGFYNSEEDKEQAWQIGHRLYWHFEPLIKSLLFGHKNRMNVERSVWTSTLEREGFEDMLSEGKVQFFELLAKYDPSSGVHFAHYIKKKLEYGIFNYLRNNSSFDNAIQTQDSLDELLKDTYTDDDYVKGGARNLLMEYIESNSESLDSSLLEEIKVDNKHLALRVAWNSLSERQKQVVDLLVHKEYTLREAGAELGVHFTTVREIRNNSFEKMQKIIEKVMK